MIKYLSTNSNKYKILNNIMFLGAPGVGKGTYAKCISLNLNIPTISTGDLIRKEIKANSKIGKQIKSYNDTGSFVPDSIMIEMVKNRLKEKDVKYGYILDGFPRNIKQAKEFDKISNLNLVINIHLPEWILIDKILGRRVCSSCGANYNLTYINKGEYKMPPLLPKKNGICDWCGGTSLLPRPDDTEEIIKHRFKDFTNQTQPLIEFYAKKGVLKRFEVKNGLADLDKLINAVKECLVQSNEWPSTN